LRLFVAGPEPSTRRDGGKAEASPARRVPRRRILGQQPVLSLDGRRVAREERCLANPSTGHVQHPERAILVTPGKKPFAPVGTE